MGLAHLPGDLDEECDLWCTDPRPVHLALGWVPAAASGTKGASIKAFASASDRHFFRLSLATPATEREVLARQLRVL